MTMATALPAPLFSHFLCRHGTLPSSIGVNVLFLLPKLISAMNMTLPSTPSFRMTCECYNRMQCLLFYGKFEQKKWGA